MGTLKVGPPGDRVFPIEMQLVGRGESPTVPGHYATVELVSRPDPNLGTVVRLLYRK